MSLGFLDRLGGLQLHPGTTAAPVPNTSIGAQTAQQPANSPYGRYTLDMDPGVVAALYQERQGLADLNSEPMPSMPSTASYDQAYAHALEDKGIQTGRLDYMFGLNKDNLAHQAVIDKRNILNSLAARGMIRSGETGYLQGEQARGYDQALDVMTHKDTWARQDLDRNVMRAQEAISAARAAANSAYSEAAAARRRGIQISQRQLHDHVIDAYVAAYQNVIENPALFLGADGNFDPRQFLGQIPG